MSEIPENIQRFNHIALLLFARLYESFPAGIEIKAVDIGHDALPKDATEQQAFDYGDGGHDVVLWLAEEGFLRYENPNQERNFYNARLTMKGLTILGYVPVSLKTDKPKEPIIEKIKHVLATGTERAGADGVKAILGQIFSLGLKFRGLQDSLG